MLAGGIPIPPGDDLNPIASNNEFFVADTSKASVPELKAWAMLATGFGLMGATGGRRARKIRLA